MVKKSKIKIKLRTNPAQSLKLVFSCSSSRLWIFWLILFFGQNAFRGLNFDELHPAKNWNLNFKSCINKTYQNWFKLFWIFFLKTTLLSTLLFLFEFTFNMQKFWLMIKGRLRKNPLNFKTRPVPNLTC